MLRCLSLLGLALCGMAHAVVPSHTDLTAEPAWKGWSRPGRASEIDIRVTSETARRTTLEVVAGLQTVRADLDLQSGRTVRLHIPVSSVERVTVSVGSPAGSSERRDVVLAQSESPLLGLGLVTGESVSIEGFHSVSLGADDLPRNSTAYSSIDALVLDSPTLGALDQRQLGALLEHAAGCGRIVVLNTNERVRRLLDGAGGCGGHTLLNAASLPEAAEKLATSLATSVPPAMSPGGVGELTRPTAVIWQRVVLCLAVYFAAAALAVLFFSSLPLLLATPVLACAAALALLYSAQPPSQLLVWSEGESGARFVRYQASQRVQGIVREVRRVPIPTQLAGSVRACSTKRAMSFGFDANRGLATFAEFETRLFDQASLCFSGGFPTTRIVEVQDRPDGSRDVRNVGTMAWAPGWLLAGGLVHELPALGPGARTMIGSGARQSSRDAAMRTALTRTPADGVGALWPLELGGVVDAPIESKGWLLVSVPRP